MKKLTLILKSFVTGYTRKDGTQVKAHSTRVTKRAEKQPGQHSLFDEDEPRKLPPNRFKGHDPVKATPDLFESHQEASKPVSKTETPAFKKWFGNSKVVDGEGKPLVVYHGTKSDVSAFDIHKAGTSDDGLAGKGFYFTYNADEASGYAESDNFGEGRNPNVMPVYVNVRNPLRIVNGVLPDGRKVTDVHKQHGAGINAKGGAAIKKIAEDGGHDGVVWVRTDGGIGHVVAFNPAQIKSATGNNGDYSDHPDMTKALIFLKARP